MAGHATAWREAWLARGMLTEGILPTVEPIAASPPRADVRGILIQAGLPSKRPPPQVPMACACIYVWPVVERCMASLLCRGAAHSRDQGHRGATVPMGVTVMAHNAATLGRMQRNQWAKRASKLRRLLALLMSRKVHQCNVSKNLWPLPYLCQLAKRGKNKVLVNSQLIDFTRL